MKLRRVHIQVCSDTKHTPRQWRQFSLGRHFFYR